MANVQFLTDSAADIPKQLRERLGIVALSFPIAVGDREYRDGEDCTPQEFYQILLAAQKIPTHSQLTSFIFLEQFESAFDAGVTDVIYTSINSKASATYQNALQARDEFFEQHPDTKDRFRIHVIDSLTYTMGYGYAIVKGAEMAQTGAAVAEIVAFIQDWVDHVRVLFTPFDLKYAKKSGRVSAAAAFVGDALGLKPVMTFEDGESKILEKVRGEKKVLSAMMDICKKTRAPETPYLVIRADNEKQSDLFLECCKNELGCDHLAMEYYIGGVISINAGPNLIGLIYRER